MIKGKAKIQLFDGKTGEIRHEIYEENMITNAVDTILNPPDFIEMGMDCTEDRSFNMLRDLHGDIADTVFRGVIVCRDKIPENGDNMMLPWTNEEIGHARIANTNTDSKIGTYNENESGEIENGKGYRHVWDFPSDKSNGEISCICLTTKDGGTCGYNDAYWDMSVGGTDLNSSSTNGFRQTFHTIVGRFINNSEFNNTYFKWFYMNRLENGNVRMFAKSTIDGGIYEFIMFDPQVVSVSKEKPFCGIISIKKVIELFPAAEKIPDSQSDTKYFHSDYYCDCDTSNVNYVPEDEEEKIRSSWKENPKWLAYFPYVIGDKIHCIATSGFKAYHYVFGLNDYHQISKSIIETDVPLQNYGAGFYYVTTSNSSHHYRWFYGRTPETDYNNALSGFEWDGRYFLVTKNPLIDGKIAENSENYGQMRVFDKSGKVTDKVFQYVDNGRLNNFSAAGFWGFYLDEKTNTPLAFCDSFNIDHSMLALQIRKNGDGYSWYRMRLSMPTYGTRMYSFANLIKVDGLTLPLYVAPYYPYSSSDKHYFGYAPGICKLCLTTINNLSEPVRKLDGQVMKITYDIVDE
ncbi:MAG: hypothetical protein HDT42_13630 [Ruminococcaceae bacterium]|nr:hypothetical protein [Oscillospiraceae bacterium]